MSEVDQSVLDVATALAAAPQCKEAEKPLLEFFINAVTIGTLCCLGIFLNLFEAVVLANMTKSNVKLLLRAESAMSILHCLFVVLAYVLPSVYLLTGRLFNIYSSKVYYKAYVALCTDVTRLCSVWLMTWACHHRYLDVCYPYSRSHMLSSALSHDEIKVIIAMGVTVHVPLLFDNALEEVPDPCYPAAMMVQRSFNQMGKNQIYIILYKLAFLPTLYVLLPLSLLVRSTCKIQKKLKEDSTTCHSSLGRETLIVGLRTEVDAVSTELDKQAYTYLIFASPCIIYTAIARANTISTGQYQPHAFDLHESLTLGVAVSYVGLIKAAMFIGFYNTFRDAAIDVLRRPGRCLRRICQRVQYAAETRRMSDAVHSQCIQPEPLSVSGLADSATVGWTGSTVRPIVCTQNNSQDRKLLNMWNIDSRGNLKGPNSSATYASVGECTLELMSTVPRPTLAGPFLSVDAISRVTTNSTDWLEAEEHCKAPLSLVISYEAPANARGAPGEPPRATALTASPASLPWPQEVVTPIEDIRAWAAVHTEGTETENDAKVVAVTASVTQLTTAKPLLAPSTVVATATSETLQQFECLQQLPEATGSAEEVQTGREANIAEIEVP